LISFGTPTSIAISSIRFRDRVRTLNAARRVAARVDFSADTAGDLAANHKVKS
jgi:hypothetical protein